MIPARPAPSVAPAGPAAGWLRGSAPAHPGRAAVAVTAAWLVLALGVAAVARIAVPGTDRQVAAAVATGALAVLATVLLRGWGDGGSLGLTGPRRWRAAGWLAVPVVLALLPVLLRPGQLARPAALLVVGYALTGWAEELVWRGVVLQLLLPTGIWRAVLISSALFGLVHLGNLAYRDAAGLVLAQAWGAFCFGVGYAGLRLRTGALWPLMITHFASDLLPHLTGSGIGVFVLQDVVLLPLGLWLARGARAARPLRSAGPTVTP